MKFIKLMTIEDFENLSAGDLIIVKWDKYIQKHNNCNEIESYKIYENKKRCEEIICKLRGNHYFNYDMHVKGQSSALEVYKVESEEDI